MRKSIYIITSILFISLTLMSFSDKPIEKINNTDTIYYDYP
jgi:hypothetical protein